MKLKEIRKELGLTQSEVAKVLRIKQQQYARYESEINNLPIKYLIKLCKYFNVSADEILGLN